MKNGAQWAPVIESGGEVCVCLQHSPAKNGMVRKHGDRAPEGLQRVLDDPIAHCGMGSTKVDVNARSLRIGMNPAHEVVRFQFLLIGRIDGHAGPIDNDLGSLLPGRNRSEGWWCRVHGGSVRSYTQRCK